MTDATVDPTRFEVNDDFILFPHSGVKIPRPAGVPIKQFRIIWEFYKKRMDARGPMSEVLEQMRQDAEAPMELFRRMADPDSSYNS